MNRWHLVLDGCGDGEAFTAAARAFVEALKAAGQSVAAHTITFEPQQPTSAPIYRDTLARPNRLPPFRGGHDGAR